MVDSFWLMVGRRDQIASNIAEGTSRMSKIDFARFIEIATGLTAKSEQSLNEAEPALRKSLLSD